MKKTFITFVFILSACGTGTDKPIPAPTTNPVPAQNDIPLIPGDHPALDYNLQIINQGIIGDCWFESSLAAFAYTKPEVLDNSIVIGPNNTWVITNYNANNSIVSTVVSPNELNNWGFGNHLNGYDANQLNWPAIFEIAYNQESPQDWNNLDYGYYPAEGLAFFANANVINTEVISNDQNSLTGYVSILQEATTYPTTLATNITTTDPNMISSHAYTVLGMQDSNILLFNPWGENYNCFLSIPVSELADNFYSINQAKF